MGLRPKLSQAEREKFLLLPKAILHQAIISRLSFIGENFVINARENGEYRDITGNLRSSIGYIVLYNGNVVGESDFNTVKDGAQGSTTGRAYADELAASYPLGYVLICVAGMNYAAAVESRGRDVITSSSLIAKVDIEKAVEALKQKLSAT